VPLRLYDHHIAHGAAAYYGLRQRPAQPYLVLTCDGFGDGACATVAAWQEGDRQEIARTDMRNSLGLLYFWTTHAYGFRPHEDEYKLMGMAPYASPRRSAEVAGIYRRYLGLDESGLRFSRRTCTSVELSWPRLADELRGRRFDDVFGGLQRFTEDLLSRWVESAVQATGLTRVLAGGGVFMNVKANQRIAALPIVEDFGAFPSCGDESLAVGAYYLAAAERYGEAAVLPLPHCYLGDDITDEEARAALKGGTLMLAFDSKRYAIDQFIAAVHDADLTARAQLVPDELVCGLRDILRAYAARTGRGVLLNTSLNLHGEPIARTAHDALRVFQHSGRRYLQLGPCLVRKQGSLLDGDAQGACQGVGQREDIAAADD
jgi:predicted NodU family carbamoyl transferase